MNSSRSALLGWRGIAVLALLPGILGAILLVTGLPEKESARLTAGDANRPGTPPVESNTPDTVAPVEGSPPVDVSPVTTVAPAAGTAGTPAATPTAPATTATTVAPRRPVKIMISGESTGLSIGTGIRTWAKTTGRTEVVEVIGGPGCALEHSGEAYWRPGWKQPKDSRCPYVSETIYFANRAKPDVIIMFIGSNQLSDWLLPGSSAPNFSYMGDGKGFDARYKTAATNELRNLASLGIPILFTTTPQPSLPPKPGPDGATVPFSMNSASRTSTLNSLSAGAVQGVPLAAMVPYAERLPKGSDGLVRQNVRPDGLHLDPAKVPAIMDAGLEADFRSAYQQVTRRVPSSARGGANFWSNP